MKTTLYLLFIGLIIAGCEKDDDTSENPVPCGETAVVSSEQYTNAPSDPLSIDSLAINDNCLTIFYGASGCDGESWDLKLIDSESILESLPPQRNVRLSLLNEEVCLAYFTKEITFDISNLQVDGNQVLLNITNGTDSILYEY